MARTEVPGALLSSQSPRTSQVLPGSRAAVAVDPIVRRAPRVHQVLEVGKVWVVPEMSNSGNHIPDPLPSRPGVAKAKARANVPIPKARAKVRVEASRLAPPSQKTIRVATTSGVPQVTP